MKAAKRDIVRSEWLLGTAYRLNGKLTEAEKHIQEALIRCRQINLVKHEANILLELARLQRDQGNLSTESLALAQEAIEIADRAQYRLQQADIRLFLAQLALDDENKELARPKIRYRNK